jgi:hypothetical protein
MITSFFENGYMKFMLEYLVRLNYKFYSDTQNPLEVAINNSLDFSGSSCHQLPFCPDDTYPHACCGNVHRFYL